MNPDLEIFFENKWRNIYDIMRIEKTKKLTPEEKVERGDKQLYADWDRMIDERPALAEELRNRIPYIDHILKQRKQIAKSKKGIKKLAREVHEETQKREKEEKEFARQEAKQRKEEEKRLAAEKQKKADEMQYKLPF